MADKGTYDPASGLRGITSKNDAPDDDDKPVSDHAGKAGRHQSFALWLTLSGGHSAPLYGHLTGAPWMNLEETRIEVPFGGRLRERDGWKEGEFVAVIKGKRLKLIFHICAGGGSMCIVARTGVGSSRWLRAWWSRSCGGR